ncbi:hypothetical protein P4O66_002499 [Electrophorus voltai]|uniref:Uncharacterized protein n=1 Tax=Electrophorus voltai TaxID=2609070 RepID=A0AAD9DPT9_9TELE|nr:hypothetical protein P4O66_002499 [Electrophorus voltai]
MDMMNYRETSQHLPVRDPVLPVLLVLPVLPVTGPGSQRQAQAPSTSRDRPRLPVLPVTGSVLPVLPGRHAVMQMDSAISVTSPVKDASTILLKDDIITMVTLEAYYTQRPHPIVGVVIIAVSLLLGLLILAMLVICLWNAGFFKRKTKEDQDKLRRDSWDYVPKNASLS